MKFKYDDEKPRRDAKAYIDEYGNLRIRTRYGDAIEIDSSGGGITGNSWNPEYSSNRRVFYEGDTITITF